MLTPSLRGSLIGLALLANAMSVPPPALERFEFSQVHMGMPVRIVLYAGTRDGAEDSARAAFARVAALDAFLSDYRSDSELTRLSATSGVWVPLTADLFAVLAQAIEVAELSDGAFDPTIGPLTALWREGRRTRRLPGATELADARARVGWRLLSLDPANRSARLERAGMRLDLGGIAKGYIVQQALATLKAHGAPRALVEAGGDIAVGDAPPGDRGWRIAVPEAEEAFRALAAALTNSALSTSGPTAQFVEIDGVRYSHVVDPRTGLGVTHGRVAHVIARDGAIADALATVIGVLGPDGGRKVRSRFPDVIFSLAYRPAR